MICIALHAHSSHHSDGPSCSVDHLITFVCLESLIVVSQRLAVVVQSSAVELHEQIGHLRSAVHLPLLHALSRCLGLLPLSQISSSALRLLSLVHHVPMLHTSSQS